MILRQSFCRTQHQKARKRLYFHKDASVAVWRSYFVFLVCPVYVNIALVRVNASARVYAVFKPAQAHYARGNEVFLSSSGDCSESRPSGFLPLNTVASGSPPPILPSIMWSPVGVPKESLMHDGALRDVETG